MHKLEKNINDTGRQVEQHRCLVHTGQPRTLPGIVPEPQHCCQARAGLHAGELSQDDHREEPVRKTAVSLQE